MSRLTLPPLNALRAFEVASRHMSFKHAADELCITPTAISHRIRTLENWLGLKLFNRLNRSLELTKEGEAYAYKVNQAFELLTQASADLKNSSEEGELVISTTMSFASNWLTEKLQSFQLEFSDLKVRVEGADSVLDLNRSNVDIAIRFGEGDYDDLHFKMLFTDYVTPICSPELAKKLRTPTDLINAPRIDYHWVGFSAKDPSWETWFTAAGINHHEQQPIPTFSDEHMALTLAKAGKGIALIGTTAVAQAIVCGELVRPFPIALKYYTYYFTCLPNMLSRHKVAVFYEWLNREAKNFEELIETDPRIKFDKIFAIDEVESNFVNQSEH
ncbi:MAG: transcriptional regulator GcvA [Oceanospirillaceae bacterium]